MLGVHVFYSVLRSLSEFPLLPSPLGVGVGLILSSLWSLCTLLFPFLCIYLTQLPVS